MWKSSVKIVCKKTSCPINLGRLSLFLPFLLGSSYPIPSSSPLFCHTPTYNMPPTAATGLLESWIIRLERHEWTSITMPVAIKQNNLNLNNLHTRDPWGNVSQQSQGMFQLKGPHVLCRPESQSLLYPGTHEGFSLGSHHLVPQWWLFPKKGAGEVGGCSGLCKYRNFWGLCVFW